MLRLGTVVCEHRGQGGVLTSARVVLDTRQRKGGRVRGELMAGGGLSTRGRVARVVKHKRAVV